MSIELIANRYANTAAPEVHSDTWHFNRPESGEGAWEVTSSA